MEGTSGRGMKKDGGSNKNEAKSQSNLDDESDEGDAGSSGVFPCRFCKDKDVYTDWGSRKYHEHTEHGNEMGYFGKYDVEVDRKLTAEKFRKWGPKFSSDFEVVESDLGVHVIEKKTGFTVMACHTEITRRRVSIKELKKVRSMCSSVITLLCPAPGESAGHLIPAAACMDDVERLKESFAKKNIVSQNGKLNSKGWCSKEKHGVKLAVHWHVLTITGVIRSDGKSIPSEWWSLHVLERTGESLHVDAFMTKNEDPKMDFWKWRCTLTDLERATGWTFLPDLERPLYLPDEGMRLDQNLKNELNATRPFLCTWPGCSHRYKHEKDRTRHFLSHTNPAEFEKKQQKKSSQRSASLAKRRLAVAGEQGIALRVSNDKEPTSKKRKLTSKPDASATTDEAKQRIIQEWLANKQSSMLNVATQTEEGPTNSVSIATQTEGAPPAQDPLAEFDQFMQQLLR